MRGDTPDRKMALALLTHSEEIRAERSDQPLARTEPALATAAAATTSPTPDRSVCDGQEKAALRGKLVRKEGQDPSGDSVADTVYDGSGEVHDFYFREFGRDSVDAAGAALISTVHHRKDYNNAFWNGGQMVYGDGRIFRTFAELSVIAHETSHAVLQNSGGLVYRGQSGALNESFADVMGALVVQRKFRQSAPAADWLIGKGILADTINGDAPRNMKAPGTAYDDPLLGQDPQPFHMDYYVNTTSDNGGVHINSGIPNHAFYLFC